MKNLTDEEFRTRRGERLEVVQLFGTTLGELRKRINDSKNVYYPSTPEEYLVLARCGGSLETPWCLLVITAERDVDGNAEQVFGMEGLTGENSLTIDSSVERVWEHWTGFVDENRKVYDAMGEEHRGVRP